MELQDVASLALATHALLIKTLVVLKADGVLTPEQIQDSLQRACALLEEDASNVTAIRARVMLESLEDDLSR